MMQSEFERLIGCEVNPYEYMYVEQVYTECDLIRDKKHIASIFIKNGIDGIEQILYAMNNGKDQAIINRASEIIREREVHFPNRHKILEWFNPRTGEVYFGTLTAIMRYHRRFKCGFWIPENIRPYHWKPTFQQKVNSLLCDIAMHHPKYYAVCRAIAVKVCGMPSNI